MNYLDIGAQSSFQMICDLRQDRPELTLARVDFFSSERATVQVTCTATDVSLYAFFKHNKKNSNYCTG